MKNKREKGKIKAWLKEKAPNILETVGDLVPDSGWLGVVKRLILNDKALGAQSKEEAIKIIELDIAELENVTQRWKYDNKSDSWLARNIRPLVFLAFSSLFLFFVILEGFENINFQLRKSIWGILESILMTIIIAYFGSRGYEKVNESIQKRKSKWRNLDL